MSVCISMLLVSNRMLYELVWYSNVLICIRMSLACTRMYPYVIRMYSCSVLVTIGQNRCTCS